MRWHLLIMILCLLVLVWDAFSLHNPLLILRNCIFQLSRNDDSCKPDNPPLPVQIEMDHVSFFVEWNRMGTVFYIALSIMILRMTQLHCCSPLCLPNQLWLSSAIIFLPRTKALMDPFSLSISAKHFFIGYGSTCANPQTVSKSSLTSQRFTGRRS